MRKECNQIFDSIHSTLFIFFSFSLFLFLSQLSIQLESCTNGGRSQRRNKLGGKIVSFQNDLNSFLSITAFSPSLSFFFFSFERKKKGKCLEINGNSFNKVMRWWWELDLSWVERVEFFFPPERKKIGRQRKNNNREDERKIWERIKRVEMMVSKIKTIEWFFFSLSLSNTLTFISNQKWTRMNGWNVKEE